MRNINYLLRCISCKKEYSPHEIDYTCPVCGDRLGTLEVIYDMHNIKKTFNREEIQPISKMGIWQFEKILPVDKNHYIPAFIVGNTPLYHSTKLAEKYGVGDLAVKDDGRNPTASFKDRASALAIVKAIEKKNNTVYCASTGNAASSLAGASAAEGMNCVIFVPASAPEAKLTQLQVYGAKVLAIDGSYDEAFDLSMKIGKEEGWYCRNSAINPYLLEGKKTGALELAVQYGWNLPDFVFVSAGDGTVLSSFYKGFMDLKELGFIEKIPTIVGVQAKGASAIIDTFEGGEPFIPVDGNACTVADSISVGKPRDVIKACTYTKRNGGLFVRVGDKEILESIIELARTTGVFSEPAGATAFAGLKKMVKTGKLSNKVRVAVVVTGNGLKDLKAPGPLLRKLEKIKPTLAGIREAL